MTVRRTISIWTATQTERWMLMRAQTMMMAESKQYSNAAAAYKLSMQFDPSNVELVLTKLH
eukprot:COSAG02_NODE_1063_length_14846_cov_134.162745_14_plen_61_part_00